MKRNAKKLSLNAETLRCLENGDLKVVDGGVRTVGPTVCTTCTNVCSACKPCF